VFEPELEVRTSRQPATPLTSSVRSRGSGSPNRFIIDCSVVRFSPSRFQADHRAHAEAISEAIERLGGRADAPKTWAQYAATYPPPKLTSETDVLRYAASLERGAAIADTKAVSRLRDPGLRTLRRTDRR
jgi:hypothetical protein